MAKPPNWSGKDVPLAESTIPLSLSAIRRRCSELLDAHGELALGIHGDGDSSQKLPAGGYDPYDHSA
ncbi:MAG: hypothetical protein WBN23_08015 [Woeseia sp.]